MTAVALKAMFPEFNCVADFVIDKYLARADRIVDARFPEADIEWARFNYAAHYMAVAGMIAGGGDMPAGLTKFKSGDVELAFSDTAIIGTGYSATRYGLEFQRLARIYTAGPLLVNG